MLRCPIRTSKLRKQNESKAPKLAMAPIPTFCMDEFTSQTDELGWIESNIKNLVTSLMNRSVAKNLSTGHSLRMASWLYDKIPPPTYPYTHSTNIRVSILSSGTTIHTIRPTSDSRRPSKEATDSIKYLPTRLRHGNRRRTSHIHKMHSI